MSDTTDIALTRPDPSFTMDVLRAQMEAAKRYVDSGLLPAGINTPQKALTIMQAGREIGVPPTYALRNIHVIEGKPTVSAELLMALVRRTYGQAAIRVKEANSLECTVQYREQGWDGTSTLKFSIADAEAAGLASRPMWKKYPRAMLRSRAVSEAVRMAFPECIAGLYTPEEMGAEVMVTSDGGLEIVDVQSELVEQPTAKEEAFDRERAIRWFGWLQGVADERQHPNLDAIMKLAANTMADAKLAKNLETLRVYFPDVTDEHLTTWDAEAEYEAAG